MEQAADRLASYLWLHILSVGGKWCFGPLRCRVPEHTTIGYPTRLPAAASAKPSHRSGVMGDVRPPAPCRPRSRGRAGWELWRCRHQERPQAARMMGWPVSATLSALLWDGYPRIGRGAGELLIIAPGRSRRYGRHRPHPAAQSMMGYPSCSPGSCSFTRAAICGAHGFGELLALYAEHLTSSSGTCSAGVHAFALSCSQMVGDQRNASTHHSATLPQACMGCKIVGPVSNISAGVGATTEAMFTRCAPTWLASVQCSAPSLWPSLRA